MRLPFNLQLMSLIVGALFAMFVLPMLLGWVARLRGSTSKTA